jgi:hypothetical protein
MNILHYLFDFCFIMPAQITFQLECTIRTHKRYRARSIRGSNTRFLCLQVFFTCRFNCINNVSSHVIRDLSHHPFDYLGCRLSVKATLRFRILLIKVNFCNTPLNDTRMDTRCCVEGGTVFAPNQRLEHTNILVASFHSTS